MKTALLFIASCLLLSGVFAKVYFEEKFDDTWTQRWKKSSWKESEGTAGEFTWTAGPFYGNEEEDKGIQTGPDARFYSIYAETEKFDNKGKDLVLQFQVRHPQELDCGGGYIKLIPASSGDKMKDFGGDTPYSIMFGPDICGYGTRKVHVIFNYKGENYLTKKSISCKTDKLSHVYTLIVHPDNTYEVLIDNEKVESGSLEDDWDMLKPKKIKDPKATKPEDWDERKKIPDPEDKKPEGYDDIPETIVDTEATKPEDWDEEEDGAWEPPVKPNPEYKGEWKAKMIDNPDYKGIWEAPEIDNPDYVPDETLYHYPESNYVGFELWQVKSGSIFDNILVTDDVEYAKKFVEDTWGKNKDAEKEMLDKQEEEKKKAEEEERKKAEAEKGDNDEDDDDEDDIDIEPVDDAAEPLDLDADIDPAHDEL